jgi:hypothetical protein
MGGLLPGMVEGGPKLRQVAVAEATDGMSCTEEGHAVDTVNTVSMAVTCREGNLPMACFRYYPNWQWLAQCSLWHCDNLP